MVLFSFYFSPIVWLLYVDIKLAPNFQNNIHIIFLFLDRNDV